MKVTIEIDDTMLKVAAGIVGMQDPSKLAEIMEFADNLGTEDISISKEQLNYFSKKDNNYAQVSLIVAILALVSKAEEDGKE